MKQSHLTLKVFFLIVLNDAVDTIAQLLMKKGVVQTGVNLINPANIAEFIAKGVSLPLLWLGIFVFVLNFFVWIVILYKIDLSVAMPVGGFCYIFVPIVAMIYLHEHVGILRWLGILCIILGIHFVAQSKRFVREGAHTNG